MDFIKLNLSLLIQLSFAGDLHVNDHAVVHKPHQFVKEKDSLEFGTDGPRSLDKRSRILKFGKYDHAGRCIFGKCERLGSTFTLTTLKDERTGTVERFRPKSQYYSSRERGSLRYDRIAKSLKESEIISKDDSKLEQQKINYYNKIDAEVASEQQKLSARRDGRERIIVRRDADIKNSDVSTQPNNSSSQAPWETTTTNMIEKTDCTTTLLKGKQDCINNESRLPYDLNGDSYMAFGSLAFLLIVLTSAVLYTGLWKKRNTMLYPGFIERERSASRRSKTDIKALLKAKLGKIPVRSRRIKDRLGKHRNHHNKRYLTLPLVENGDAGLADDESDDSGEERISEEEEEEESVW